MLFDTIQEELRPLSSLLHKLKGVATPELITLQEWRTTIFENANAAATAPISLTEGTNVSLLLSYSFLENVSLNCIFTEFMMFDKCNCDFVSRLKLP